MYHNVPPLTELPDWVLSPSGTYVFHYTRASTAADNHTGVCIVFDKKRLHESVHAAFTVVGRIPGLVRVFDGPVDYSDQPPIIMIGTVPWDPYLLKRDEVEKHGIDFIVDRQVRSFHRQIYFTKNTDWKAEAEYRWVVYGVNAEYTTLPVADALVAVILGVDISQDDREQILAIAESTGLSVSIAIWRGHSFGIHDLFRGA